MAGAAGGFVDMATLRKDRRAATQSYSCTAKRFKKLISEMAPIAKVEAEYQKMVATYQCILVLHREVVSHTGPEALDKEHEYEDERRQEYDGHTELISQYRLAQNLDVSIREHVSRMVANSVQVVEEADDMEESSEETESIEETEDDPRDDDYDPAVDGFVEDAPEVIAAQILRDAQVPQATQNQQGAAMEAGDGPAGPGQDADVRQPEAETPVVQPAADNVQSVNLNPAASAPTATGQSARTAVSHQPPPKVPVKRATKMTSGTKVPETRRAVKSKTGSPIFDNQYARQPEVQPASGPAAGDHVTDCLHQIMAQISNLGTRIQSVEENEARVRSAPQPTLSVPLPPSGGILTSTPTSSRRPAVNFASSVRRICDEDEEGNHPAPNFPVELTSRFLQTSRSRGASHGAPSSTLKLPKVEPTPFDGDMMRWDAFASSFDYFVHQCETNDAARLLRLRSLLTPAVQDRVAEFLHDPRMYGECIKKLKLYYGDPERIAQLHIRTIMNLPNMKDDTAKSLSAFSDKLHVAAAALTATGNDAELSNRSMMLLVVSKLTKTLKRR